MIDDRPSDIRPLTIKDYPGTFSSPHPTGRNPYGIPTLDTGQLKDSQKIVEGFLSRSPYRSKPLKLDKDEDKVIEFLRYVIHEVALHMPLDGPGFVMCLHGLTAGHLHDCISAFLKHSAVAAATFLQRSHWLLLALIDELFTPEYTKFARVAYQNYSQQPGVSLEVHMLELLRLKQACYLNNLTKEQLCEVINDFRKTLSDPVEKAAAQDINEYELKDPTAFVRKLNEALKSVRYIQSSLPSKFQSSVNLATTSQMSTGMVNALQSLRVNDDNTLNLNGHGDCKVPDCFICKLVVSIAGLCPRCFMGKHEVSKCTNSMFAPSKRCLICGNYHYPGHGPGKGCFGNPAMRQCRLCRKYGHDARACHPDSPATNDPPSNTARHPAATNNGYSTSSNSQTTRTHAMTTRSMTRDKPSDGDVTMQ